MLELIWILGIILTVLVFGIIIGLTIGFQRLSKKVALVIAAGYGIGILIPTYLVSLYTNIIYKAVNDYNFVIFTVISSIIIFTGFYTLRKWKIHHRDSAKTSWVSLIVLFPCCLGAVAATIVLITPLKEVSAAAIGQFAAVFLSLTIMTFYFTSGAITNIIKKPYPILLSNSMLFVGLYYLASAIIIPNINSVLKSPMSPMNIPFIETLIYTAIFVIILAFIGFYKTKKQSNLIQR